MTLLLASTAAEPPLALLKELSFTEDDFYSMTTEDLAREQDRLYNFSTVCGTVFE